MKDYVGILHWIHGETRWSMERGDYIGRTFHHEQVPFEAESDDTACGLISEIAIKKINESKLRAAPHTDNISVSLKELASSDGRVDISGKKQITYTKYII